MASKINKNVKAVISLGNTQIHKYTKEQSRTFCFGWCLLCGGMFLGVFFARTESESANAQIRT